MNWSIVIVMVFSFQMSVSRNSAMVIPNTTATMVMKRIAPMASSQSAVVLNGEGRCHV